MIINSLIFLLFLLQARNHIHVNGRTVNGDLHVQMNLQDIIVNTLALSHSSALYAIAVLQGAII